MADPGLSKVDIFHKKYGESNKRHRVGYDESLGPLLSSTKTATDLVESSDPVRLLTDTHVIVFSGADSCQTLLRHPKTTEELKECFKDLKVLGKVDFKKIMKWRSFIRNERVALEMTRKREEGSVGDPETDKKDKYAPLTDEQIQEEIMEMQEKQVQEVRREKKKEKKLAAKQRERRALGISNESIAQEEDEEVSNLFALLFDPSLFPIFHIIFHRHYIPLLLHSAVCYLFDPSLSFIFHITPHYLPSTPHPLSAVCLAS